MTTLVPLTTGVPKIILTDAAFADFSRDNRWLLTQSDEKVQLWDADSLLARWEIAGEAYPGAFSSDGQYIVIYRTAEEQIQVVKVETGDVVNHFAASSMLTGREPFGSKGISISVLRFHPTKPELLIQISPIYEYSDADDRYERMAQDRAIYTVHRQAFGPQVISHSKERHQGNSFDGRYQVRVGWNTTKIVDTIESNVVNRAQEGIQTVHFSRDARYALLITAKHSQVLELPEGHVVHQFDRIHWSDNHVGYSLPHTVWILDQRNNLLIDGVSGEVAHRLEHFATTQFAHLHISPSGRYVVGMDQLQTIHLQDLETGEVSTHYNERLGVKDVLLFSPDERQLLVMVETMTPTMELEGLTLHDAIAQGKFAEVKYLLGVPETDVDALDEHDRTPLWWAVKDRKTAIVDLLVARGADPTKGVPFLHDAIVGGYNALAIRMVEAGLEANVCSGKGNYPLREAAKRGAVDLVRTLLRYNADPNFLHETHLQVGSILDLAIENGHEEAAHLLLEHGADPNGVTPPLSLALSQGMNDLAQQLLERGADPNLEAQQGKLRGCRPLEVAIDHGNVNGVRLLLEHDVDLDVQISYQPPLLYAVEKGEAEIVRLLVESGVDISESTAVGTALDFAVQKNDEDIVKLLLQYPIDVNAESEFGYTALDNAEEGSTIEALLLEHGAKHGSASEMW